MKKLYRSRTDRKLCGVCGGFAEYFEIDATILRILLIIFVLCGGAGILAYIVAALVMQNNPNQ
jgi:phage shock protein PspC (stress-responsive transcriptional regulator)